MLRRVVRPRRVEAAIRAFMFGLPGAILYGHTSGGGFTVCAERDST